MHQRAFLSISQRQLTLTMLEKGLLGLAVLVVILLLYLLLCKIWQWFNKSSDKEGEVTEPLISEDLPVGQTVRRPALPRLHADGDSIAGEDHFGPSVIYNVDKHTISTSEEIETQCSNLVLEVISGPSSGVRISQQSINACGLSLKIGRVPQNDLVLNDPEVSGKHAIIYWNLKNSKWELVDMGSLNGTLLNFQPVSTADSNVRHRSDPVELASGDIVTFGSTSKVLVQIVDRGVSQFSLFSVPFGVGIASDPMNMRRGGRQLPMEDVCHCEWPLCGIQQFGVFCIFDGHGGVAAAEAASKVMPQKLADILMVPERRQKVLMNCDATDVLADAFRQAEEALDHQYEGCTATVLLLWSNFKEDLFAQCANVGDSACIFKVGDKNICMTEDHRLTSLSEKTRMLELGKQLKEGETRLCGMNIARVLGDKFLKEQDSRFSAEPYISEALQIRRESKALALLASDGLWDVLSPKRALQLALEARDSCHMDEGNVLSAEDIANLVVREARMLRTKDNTTVIVLDFATKLHLFVEASITRLSKVLYIDPVPK